MSLSEIQQELKCPKGLTNKFGGYKYRSCENVLEALKPLLTKYKATLFITDEIKELGDILFVEATCVVRIGEEQIVAKAQAGINPNRKGMDIAQSFGSSSSYARKYALNAMFLLDDSADADTMDNSSQNKTPSNASSNASKPDTDYVKGLKNLCKQNELEFLDVCSWAKAVKKKDITEQSNAKDLTKGWSKLLPEINAWLIINGG